MELVYLWVEEYKNLKEQGFNFSSRFECEYDKDSNELIINKNEDYIDNFFGENINVTAIVGKNGSGKSSLLDSFINTNIDCKFFDNNGRIITKDAFLEDNIILFHNEDIDSENYTNQYNINQIVKDNLEITNRYILNNIAISFLFNSNQDFLSHLSFIPEYIQLEPLLKINENDFINILHRRIEYIDDMADAMQSFNISNSNITKLKEFIQKKLDEAIDVLDKDISYYLYIREFLYKLNHNHSQAFSIVEDIIMEYIKEDVDFKAKLYKELYSNESENIFNTIINEFREYNISFEYHSNNFIVKIDDKNIEKLLSNIHRGFFNVHFFKKFKNDNIYFNNLSNGEQKLILLFAKIFYVIRKLGKGKDKKDFYILLDEPDIYLHPQWQKQIISFFITFITSTDSCKNKIFNIIFTTHSPFLLSDIPKQNIIFLDKDKNGNCKIIDGLKDKKQTFGANIHTLLSDGFFMQGGLMGEFAKGKIDEAIKLLNSPNKLLENELKYCEQIISIIGEPIIKNQLQRMLDSKKISYLAKDTKEEIEFLKNRIDILSKRL